MLGGFPFLKLTTGQYTLWVSGRCIEGGSSNKIANRIGVAIGGLSGFGIVIATLYGRITNKFHKNGGESLNPMTFVCDGSPDLRSKEFYGTFLTFLICA